MSGLHRSPRTGFSTEFSEYREYSPGDDVRFLDWKVMARTDREFIKKFEDETNLRCMFLVDFSKSMEFGGDDAGVKKSDYARTFAASRWRGSSRSSATPLAWRHSTATCASSSRRATGGTS